jgi:hypothetical protein
MENHFEKYSPNENQQRRGKISDLFPLSRPTDQAGREVCTLHDKSKHTMMAYFLPNPTRKPTKPEAIALTIPAAHFLSSGMPVANT